MTRCYNNLFQPGLRPPFFVSEPFGYLAVQDYLAVCSPTFLSLRMFVLCKDMTHFQASASHLSNLNAMDVLLRFELINLHNY